MSISINENNLRNLAYQIWESEGRPTDQADRHWFIALNQISTRLSSDGSQDFILETDSNVAHAGSFEEHSISTEHRLSAQSHIDIDIPDNAQQSANDQKEKTGKRKKNKEKLDIDGIQPSASTTQKTSRKNSGKNKNNDNILV